MKNPAKILFFDVDGTLFNSQKKLPQATIEALQKAKQNGYEIAIATGRGPFMITELLAELDIHTYVTFNGQYVVYNDKLVYSNGVPSGRLDEIIGFAEKRGEYAAFLDAERIVTNVANNHTVAEALTTLKMAYPPVDKEYYKKHAVYQTLLFIDEQAEKIYAKEFTDVQFVRWHRNSCDVLPQHGSKAQGIAQLIKTLGYTMADVIAFGDGLNDVEMLEAVGTGVAMANGHDKAKAVADYIAPHVDEDGLAKIMKELNLIS